jgi:hypothetical protein
MRLVGRVLFEWRYQCSLAFAQGLWRRRCKQFVSGVSCVDEWAADLQEESRPSSGTCLLCRCELEQTAGGCERGGEPLPTAEWQRSRGGRQIRRCGEG